MAIIFALPEFLGAAINHESIKPPSFSRRRQMKPSLRLFALAALAFIALAGSALLPAGGTTVTHAAAGEELSGATESELGRARAGTASYHNIAQAEAAEYANIDVFVSGRGFHYLNPGLLDATFEADKPEILVYAPCRTRTACGWRPSSTPCPSASRPTGRPKVSPAAATCGRGTSSSGCGRCTPGSGSATRTACSPKSTPAYPDGGWRQHKAERH